MKKLLLAAMMPLAAVATASVAAPQKDSAQSDSGNDLIKKFVNAPAPASLNVYGLETPPKVIDDKEAKGGKALHVDVPKAGDKPWSVSLSSPTTKPVKAGDQIIIAFFAKAVKGDDGGQDAKIANVALQLSKAPYTGIFGEPQTVKPGWAMYQVAGKVDKDYAAGDIGVSMQLANAAHTIDFGPVIILDMGQS